MLGVASNPLVDKDKKERAAALKRCASYGSAEAQLCHNPVISDTFLIYSVC